MHRRKKKATDETAGVKLPTKRRRKEINNSLPIIGNPHIPQVGLTHRNGDHPNVFVDITNTQNTIQREARNQRANILRQKRKFAGPNVSNDQLTQPSLLPKLSVELPQQRGHVEATIPTQSSILTNGSGFIPRKKLKVTRNKNLSSGFAAHNTSQSSHMSNQVSQISSKGNSLEDNFVVRSHEPDNATACILSDFTEPIQANRSKAIRQRSTSQPSIIDQQDSDSSDSCDAYWDCSSNEGGDEIAPSDESDDDVEYNKKKFACMEHVSKYSAEVFGGLVIPQTREDNMVVSPVITEAEYKDDGDLTNECPICGALFWYNERIGKKRKTKNPIFTMCCMRGKIKLPLLKEPPPFLIDLLTKDDAISKHFRDNIRPLNMMFSFTSLGGKIDNSINRGNGPKIFRLHGENYHLIGSMKPDANETAKFSQLYIHDTENEVENRLCALSGNGERTKIRADLVQSIMEMLRECNVHVKTFRNAMDRFNSEDECEDLSLVLINSREKDGRIYNLPTSSEVAALVVGDFQNNMDKRDIILEKKSGKVKRINELHPCYLPLQYPLIFPYGEDGFRLVAANDGNSNLPIEGNRIIIPSSFTGGPLYMHQMYLDAMSICKYYGFPDLFITFTSNPKWPELTRYFRKYNLRSEDRPELCCRLLKIKLDSLMENLTKKHVLGKTVSAEGCNLSSENLEPEINEIKKNFVASLSSPRLVWESTKDLLSEDILFLERKKRRNPGLIMSEEQILNATLILIENIMHSKNSTLEKTMPKPIDNSYSLLDNQLLQNELNYSHYDLRERHDEWFGQMTDEQRSVKTFLWNILSAAVRSRGEVVLNVAYSGIAALLLHGGRTAHSRFSLPINPDEFSTRKIQPGSDQAELIYKSSLTIWDEAPMMSKHCFEALDRTICDIMKTTDDTPFGGKVVVFGGDFRQILPVIPRGNRADIVMAALNSSYLWKYCKVLQLTKNMRLLSELGKSVADDIKTFLKWILDVGDGKINEPNNGETIINIPKNLLITECGDPIEAIVSETYGNTFKDSKDPIFFFQERAILCPTNEEVDVVNNYMLDRLTGT
ncbi:unnamed protein product [Brassica oleracea var. botrytis]